MDNDTVVVLRVNRHILAAEKPFSEVKAAISEQLEKEQAVIDAMNFGKALLALPKGGPEQTEQIENHHLSWKTINKASRETELAPELINELAFNLSKPKEAIGQSLPNGDFIIVDLRSINPGDFSSLDKEHINSVTQQVQASYGVMDYDLYVASLMSKANIVRH